jgi:hypothetical protein
LDEKSNKNRHIYFKIKKAGACPHFFETTKYCSVLFFFFCERIALARGFFVFRQFRQFRFEKIIEIELRTGPII